jgi:predicted alpha/beta-hydrolase family hydrolase
VETEGFLFDGPDSSPVTLVLAHGAGAPMDSPFLNRVATGVAAEGFRVARFEFPYMRARRGGGKAGAPDRAPVLVKSWLDAIERLGGGANLAIGGKSLGGRIASMVADEARVRGLVCLGYPFHPPGRPERLRTGHLESLETRALFVQGTRDPFGGREEVESYRLSPKVEIHWIPDGDHSWKPRASSGRTEAQNLSEGIDAAVRFLKTL